MQLDLFEMFGNKYKIDHRIRLIELFGGIGSQAKALENIGADFEHYRLVEFDKYACDSYNAVHGTNFVPMDIRDIKGEDLGITDTEHFTYLLTLSPVPICLWQVCKWVCQKVVEQEVVCFGKSKDYFARSKISLKSY